MNSVICCDVKECHLQLALEAQQMLKSASLSAIPVPEVAEVPEQSCAVYDTRAPVKLSRQYINLQGTLPPSIPLRIAPLFEFLI